MKKTLLCFLFLLFSNLFSAQVSDLQGCETYPIFNLTERNVELIGNLNPSETTLSYHLSLNDAINNINAISNPMSFDSPESKTIYARINHNGTVTTNFFKLTFFPPSQIVGLKTSPSCEEPRTKIMLVSMMPGASQNFSYSLDYGQSYLPNRDFYLEPGNYTILIKDPYNCKTDNPVFMQVDPYNPLLAAAIVTEGVNCGDKDSVKIYGSGGQAGEYTFSFDGINYSRSDTSNNLKAGNHTVFVKDQMGCIASTTISINNYKANFTSIISVNPISCIVDKGSITAQGFGGKSPYQYSLNSGNYQSGNTFDNLVPGNYIINTKDALGCISSFIAVIKSYIPITATTILKNISCNGQKDGSIEINANGGDGPFSYSLSNTSGLRVVSQSENIFKNVPAGIYTVEIIDDNGCMLSQLVTIKEPAVLVTTSKVENQKVTVNTTGGTGTYQYSIDQSNDFTSNNIFSNVSFGNHNMSVKDENGCTNLIYFSVNPPAPLLEGKAILNILFKLGQTLADLIIEGQNIKWYSTPGNSTTGKTSKSAEATLPDTTVLVDGTTYYASQTIDGIESNERLAVTAKVNGSLASPDFDLADFNYFPNPVQNLLNISNSSNIDSIEVISVSGKSILSKKINNTYSEIDLSGISSGFYFLKVKSEGKSKTIKIIKK